MEAAMTAGDTIRWDDLAMEVAAIELAAGRPARAPGTTPRRRQVPLTPMRVQAAKSMARLADGMREASPDQPAHQHVRDAARQLRAGNEDAAERHLRAAMFALTPQSLHRAGQHTDDAHTAARLAMHGVHRHLLLVKDISDVAARNQQAIARDSYGDDTTSPPEPSSPLHPRAGFGPGALAQKPTARQPGGDRAMNAPARQNDGGPDPHAADPEGPQPKGSKQFTTWGDIAAVVELASSGGHHIPGTGYDWRHGYVPLTVAAARSHGHGKIPKDWAPSGHGLKPGDHVAWMKGSGVVESTSRTPEGTRVRFTDGKVAFLPDSTALKPEAPKLSADQQALHDLAAKYGLKVNALRFGDGYESTSLISREGGVFHHDTSHPGEVALPTGRRIPISEAGAYLEARKQNPGWHPDALMEQVHGTRGGVPIRRRTTQHAVTWDDLAAVVVELTGDGHGHHVPGTPDEWKHGYIPLTEAAARSHFKGHVPKGWSAPSGAGEHAHGLKVGDRATGEHPLYGKVTGTVTGVHKNGSAVISAESSHGGSITVQPGTRVAVDKAETAKAATGHVGLGTHVRVTSGYHKGQEGHVVAMSGKNATIEDASGARRTTLASLMEPTGQPGKHVTAPKAPEPPLTEANVKSGMRVNGPGMGPGTIMNVKRGPHGIPGAAVYFDQQTSDWTQGAAPHWVPLSDLRRESSPEPKGHAKVSTIQQAFGPKPEPARKGTPAPAKPEWKRQLEEQQAKEAAAGEANARGMEHMMALHGAQRAHVKEALGIKDVPSAVGLGLGLGTQDYAEAESRLLNGRYGEAVAAMDRAIAAERNGPGKATKAREARLAKLAAFRDQVAKASQHPKDTPLPALARLRGTNSAMTALDHNGTEYKVGLRGGKITVSHGGKTLSAPAGDNPTLTARTLAAKVAPDPQQMASARAASHAAGTALQKAEAAYAQALYSIPGSTVKGSGREAEVSRLYDRVQAAKAASNAARSKLRALQGVTLSVTWDDLAAVIELASSGGHHIPGTPFDWRHGFIPLSEWAARSHFKGKIPKGWRPAYAKNFRHPGTGSEDEARRHAVENENYDAAVRHLQKMDRFEKQAGVGEGDGMRPKIAAEIRAMKRIKRAKQSMARELPKLRGWEADRIAAYAKTMPGQIREPMNAAAVALRAGDHAAALRHLAKAKQAGAHSTIGSYEEAVQHLAGEAQRLQRFAPAAKAVHAAHSWDDLAVVVELASSGGHHIPGTPFDWKHSYIPLTEAAARSHFKGKIPSSWHPTANGEKTSGLLKAGDWVAGHQALSPAPVGILGNERSRDIGGHSVHGSYSDPWWVVKPGGGWAVSRRWKSPAQKTFDYKGGKGHAVTIPARDERVVTPWKGNSGGDLAAKLDKQNPWDRETSLRTMPTADLKALQAEYAARDAEAAKRAKILGRKTSGPSYAGEQVAREIAYRKLAGTFENKAVHAAYSWDDLATVVELSAKTAALEHTPRPYGKPGGPGLYGVKGMKHSDYFEQVVHGLMSKRGMGNGQASRIAWGVLRRWAKGGGHVHPEVRAAAARALAKERANAAKARAVHHHAATWDDVGSVIVLAFNQAENRVPSGQGGGGRFTSGGGGGPAAQGKPQAKAKAAPKPTAAQRAHAAHVAHVAHEQHVSTQKAQLLVTAQNDRAKAAQLVKQRDALQKELASASGKTSTGQAGAKTATTAKTKTTAKTASTAKTATTAKASTAKASTATAKAAATAKASTTASASAAKTAQIKAQIAQLNTQIAALLAAAWEAQSQAAKVA